MKVLFTLALLCLTTLCQGQAGNYPDSVLNSVMWKRYDDDTLKQSLRIYDEMDTVYYPLKGTTLKSIPFQLRRSNNFFDCIDGTTIIEKGHNYCQILKGGVPFSGYIKIRRVKRDSAISVFSGTLKNGYIEDGSFIEFYHNGNIRQTGQYQNNWKIGIWTSFYPTGGIEFLEKYIEGTDSSMVWFDYDDSGKLVDYSDEESIMKKRIEEMKKR